LSAVAVVVPSVAGDTSRLRASLAGQTLQPSEVEVVRGVRPNGRARNVGVQHTRSPMIVFLDDDATLGAHDTIERLVAPLSDPTMGASGCGKLIPPGSSRFQRRVARQVPRVEHGVVSEARDSTPPGDRHGYTVVTTTCCAMRRDVLERCGGFDERLERGVDSELFHRMARSGYRLVVAPNAWAWHPAPETLRALLAKHFAYGIGYAQTVQKHPELGGRRYLRTPAHALAYVLVRTLALLPHAFFPASAGKLSVRPGFRPLGALASYAAGLGYVWGWYRHPYRGG
jgi:GT2 family glycosyltransferase